MELGLNRQTFIFVQKYCLFSFAVFNIIAKACRFIAKRDICEIFIQYRQIIASHIN